MDTPSTMKMGYQWMESRTKTVISQSHLWVSKFEWGVDGIHSDRVSCHNYHC